MWGGQSMPGKAVNFPPVEAAINLHEGMNGLPDTLLEVTTHSESETRQLGQDIAMTLRHGVIYLKGDLGSGKSVLARAMIRQLCDDTALEVPSPTFSLVQSYTASPRHGSVEILHADLYRIADPAECNELGLNSADDDTLALIEWPEKGEGELPAADVEITVEEPGTGGAELRSVRITGQMDALAAIGRSLSVRRFLDTGWKKGVGRRRFQGDASTRRYETADAGGETRILMDAPKQPDGPPVRDGKPYSRIAHLAEDVSAFAGVARILHSAGLAVPRLYACDLEAGLILLEHLGEGTIVNEDRLPVRERYLASAAMLAEFHQEPLVTRQELPNGTVYEVPAYDRGAMLIETELLIDWFLPRFRGNPATQAERDAFLEIWNALIDRLAESEKRLCCRDFHSPNIIWRENHQGSDRVGLIDFQDAVVGPSAYDLASLAQDARTDVSRELETDLLDHYCAQRKTAGAFDETSFRQDYAIMAAQRATKILGIFVRLDERDGKPGYLRHLPRLQNYLYRSFSHPALADYRQWYEQMFGKNGVAFQTEELSRR